MGYSRSAPGWQTLLCTAFVTIGWLSRINMRRVFDLVSDQMKLIWNKKQAEYPFGYHPKKLIPTRK